MTLLQTAEQHALSGDVLQVCSLYEPNCWIFCCEPSPAASLHDAGCGVPWPGVPHEDLWHLCDRPFQEVLSRCAGLQSVLTQGHMATQLHCHTCAESHDLTGPSWLLSLGCIHVQLLVPYRHTQLLLCTAQKLPMTDQLYSTGLLRRVQWIWDRQ